MVQDLIRKPVISEKSIKKTETGEYTFVVSRNANKTEVKKAIESQFKVKVKSVRTMNMPAKKRTRGKTIGRISAYKKAIVKLKSGKIDVFGKV